MQKKIFLKPKGNEETISHLQEVLTLRGVQRELKSLRNQNLSLSHDNKELRQSIERLKQLDMELEQKIRR